MNADQFKGVIADHEPGLLADVVHALADVFNVTLCSPCMDIDQKVSLAVANEPHGGIPMCRACLEVWDDDDGWVDG